MGIVYQSKSGRGYVNKVKEEYISKPKCVKKISRHRTTKALTRRNIQYLKSLGYKAKGGK